MSLRAQIHDAIDEVTPPAPWLERKVAAYVIADDRKRVVRLGPTRPPWANRFRGVAALVAAALVLVLAGGLVLGGRFWRNVNSPPSSVSQVELKNLEGRQLHFPTVAAGAACPATAETLNQKIGMVFGDGPVYVVNGNVVERTAWGDWQGLNLEYDARSAGLVLMRATDLQSDREVAFVQYPVAPSGITAVGKVLGREHALDHDLNLRSEAAFQDPSHTPQIDYRGTHPQLLVVLGMQKGSSGCIGLQIDGPNFTELIVLNFLDWRV